MSHSHSSCDLFYIFHPHQKCLIFLICWSGYSLATNQSSLPVVDLVVRSGYCRCIDYAAVAAAAAGVEVGVWVVAALSRLASMKCLTFGWGTRHLSGALAVAYSRPWKAAEELGSTCSVTMYVLELSFVGGTPDFSLLDKTVIIIYFNSLFLKNVYNLFDPNCEGGGSDYQILWITEHSVLFTNFSKLNVAKMDYKMYKTWDIFFSFNSLY